MNKTQWYRAGVYFASFLVLVLFLFSVAVATIDISVVQFMQDHRSAIFTDTMKVLTYLGDWKVVIPFLIGAAYIAMRQKNTLLKNQLYSVVLSALVYMVIIFFLKDLFNKIRPAALDQLVTEASFSFPSGHVGGAMVIAGVCSLFVRYLGLAWQKTVLIFGVLLVILVSYSRMYLGVHWLSDVAGSILLGMVWITITPLVIYAVYPAEDRKNYTAQ